MGSRSAMNSISGSDLASAGVVHLGDGPARSGAQRPPHAGESDPAERRIFFAASTALRSLMHLDVKHLSHDQKSSLRRDCVLKERLDSPTLDCHVIEASNHCVDAKKSTRELRARRAC